MWAARDIDAGQFEHPCFNVLRFRRLGRQHVQLLATLGQGLSFNSISKKAVMADSHESPRKHMHQESSQELICGKRCDLAPVSIGAVSIDKADKVIIYGE